MATLTDLRTAAEDATLRNKVSSAIVIKCAALLGETQGTNLTNRQKWAAAALASPDAYAQRVLNGVLAINAASTLATIQAAADATIQAAVNTVIDTVANYGP